MPYQSVVDKILRRIRAAGRGTVYTAGDFLDLGSRASVDQSLTRLVRAGAIRRLGRGLYDYPRVSARLGPLAPSVATLKRAIARKTGASVAASGAQIANMLGLTTQVPAKTVFETTGRTRRVKVGQQQIELRPTSPRNVRKRTGVADDVIRALKHLGRAAITDDIVAQLRRTLSATDRVGLLKAKRRAPTWMHRILERIAAEV